MTSKTYQILYVEDQPEAVNLMRLALRRLGCEVHGAGDGIVGVKMMHDLRPDLVMLDLMLPGCDGWQVREAMQADDQLCHTPVVIVSARVPMSGRNDRQPPAADAYVTKPFSLVEIRSTVERLLCLPAALSCPS